MSHEIEYLPEDEHTDKNALFIDCPCCNANLALDFSLVSKHVDTIRAFENYKRIFKNQKAKPFTKKEIEPIKMSAISYLTACRMLGDLKQKRQNGTWRRDSTGV